MSGETSPEVERLRALTGKLGSPELYERVLETLPDALVIIGADGEIMAFNTQAEFLFGYHRSEVLGRKVEMLVPEALRQQHASHRSGYMEEPRTRPMGEALDLSAQHKSGKLIPVAINLSPITTHEGVYVSAIVRRRK